MTGPKPATAVPPPGQQPSRPSILSKAFLLLECFSAEERVLTLTELADRSGLPKSTVHRVLDRLVSLGIIEGHDRKYRIGMRLFAITTAMPASNLRELCLPALARLQAWAGGVAHLAVLRGVHVVYLERIVGSGNTVPAPAPGNILPAHGSALGKALLARLTVEERSAILPDPLPRMTPATITDRAALERQLQEIRRSNIALSLAEWNPGVYSVASALVVHRRQVGAIAISKASPAELTDELKVALRRTAETLGELIRERIDAGETGWHPVEDLTS
ncbi:DNA-binding transcriptional regulator, IclR family [Raineyella antarctica]|uniref:DNA-binding transcriptional regulator, IclR family n=1 Tax=Raineyella antarctica TaxID=1577474 RepID=A0A1G6H4H8_9ACTN|nr:IclR family transcriptional regulator [Raineyella antarctica]SDB88815.1 DNA-binding transcriptional regulator, IclR family [Raineyella antarctica]